MVASALERARGGDERAFQEVTQPHVRELHVHCYRMLGSVVDAEDIVQETLLAAWRGLDGFAGRSSLRTWLYRIATNRCLNAVRDRARRLPAQPIPPFEPPEPSRRSEVTWLQPCPDSWLADAEPGQALDPASDPLARYEARERIEFAFIAALQRLPPRQTAALLLCDVLDFSTADVAGMFDTTPTTVKGLLQRARSTLGRQAPPAGPAAPMPGSAAERALVRRFADAFASDDVDGVIALLTDDAWLAMPPAPHEYHGHAAIAAFLRASNGWHGARRFRLVPTRANTQPAFGCYLTRADQPGDDYAGLLVLTLSGERISAITRFLGPETRRTFGLAEAVATGPG